MHVAYGTRGCNYTCNLTGHGTWLKLASQFITNFGDAGLLAIVQIGNIQFCTVMSMAGSTQMDDIGCWLYDIKFYIMNK